MTTVRQIIEAAGRKIGVNNMGAEGLSDGLEAFNMMLRQWSAIPSTVPAVDRETFSLSSSTASYTVGDGATIDTEWPYRIKSIFIRSGSVDYPITPFSAEEYAYTGQKADERRPVAIYYERTYPSGSFFFWPTPDQSYTVHMWSQKALGNFTSYATTLTIHPSYEPAFIYNLAVELAPEYEREPSQMVALKAMSTYKTIKNMNLHPVPQIRTDVICGPSVSPKALFEDDGFPFAFPFVLR